MPAVLPGLCVVAVQCCSCVLPVHGEAWSLIWRNIARVRITQSTGTTFDVHFESLRPRLQQLAGSGAGESCGRSFAAHSSFGPSARTNVDHEIERLQAGGGKEKDAFTGLCEVCVWRTHLLLGLAGSQQRGCVVCRIIAKHCLHDVR